MNTSPKHWLHATPAGDHSTQIEIKDHENRLTLIGASCPASAQELTGGITSFSLTPRGAGKTDVVAVKVTSGGWHKTPTDLFYFFAVTNEGAKPFVHLEKPFRCDTCLPQLAEEGLYVTIGEERFVAPNFAALNQEKATAARARWAEEGVKMVDSPNLLCRFMVGLVTTGDLRASAQVVVDAEALPARHEALALQHTTLSAEHRQTTRDLDTATQALIKRTKQLREAENTTRSLRAQIQELQQASSLTGWRRLLNLVPFFASFRLGRVRTMALQSIGE